MQDVFAQLAKGDGRPFRDLMAEDFCWTVAGTTKWSKTYGGKEAVLKQLFEPLMKQFADRYTNTAQRIHADGDFVIVECKGRVTTTSGKPYNNTYCMVIRMAAGKMKELTEYLDTALVESALQPPG